MRWSAFLYLLHRSDGSATFDFTGTGPEVYGNLNAPPAVAYSAIIYSLRCLVTRDIPLNQGCLAPIKVRQAVNHNWRYSFGFTCTGGHCCIPRKHGGSILSLCANFLADCCICVCSKTLFHCCGVAACFSNAAWCIIRGA